MTKFIVDPETLGYVANGLVDLNTVLGEIPGMTEGAGPTPFGGEMVLDALERFDADWRVGRDLIAGEIASLQERLDDAMRAYTLIEERVREGATGVIDIGRLGFGVVGSEHPDHGRHDAHGGHGGHDGHGSSSGTGTTTIG